MAGDLPRNIRNRVIYRKVNRYVGYRVILFQFVFGQHGPKDTYRVYILPNQNPTTVNQPYMGVGPHALFSYQKKFTVVTATSDIPNRCYGDEKKSAIEMTTPTNVHVIRTRKIGPITIKPVVPARLRPIQVHRLFDRRERIVFPADSDRRFVVFIITKGHARA